MKILLYINRHTVLCTFNDFSLPVAYCVTRSVKDITKLKDIESKSEEIEGNEKQWNSLKDT